MLDDRQRRPAAFTPPRHALRPRGALRISDVTVRRAATACPRLARAQSTGVRTDEPCLAVPRLGARCSDVRGRLVNNRTALERTGTRIASVASVTVVPQRIAIGDTGDENAGSVDERRRGLVGAKDDVRAEQRFAKASAPPARPVATAWVVYGRARRSNSHRLGWERCTSPAVRVTNGRKSALLPFGAILNRPQALQGRIGVINPRFRRPFGTLVSVQHGREGRVCPDLITESLEFCRAQLRVAIHDARRFELPRRYREPLQQRVLEREESAHAREAAERRHLAKRGILPQCQHHASVRGCEPLQRLERRILADVDVRAPQAPTLANTSHIPQPLRRAQCGVLLDAHALPHRLQARQAVQAHQIIRAQNFEHPGDLGVPLELRKVGFRLDAHMSVERPAIARRRLTTPGTLEFGLAARRRTARRRTARSLGRHSRGRHLHRTRRRPLSIRRRDGRRTTRHRPKKPRHHRVSPSMLHIHHNSKAAPAPRGGAAP